MIVVGYDATHQNVSRLPKGSQAAGYTTGSASIAWTNADWARFPGAVRICQDLGATDTTADVLDVESGAATPGDCPGWAKKATANYTTNVRPGQRTPAIYTSASNVTTVANALVNGGVKSGVGLWVANWSLTEAQAIADVQAASGPFPIIGVQYSSGSFFDYDIWAAAWLSAVSGNFATNPVADLAVTKRGFTSITLAWKGQENASDYEVKAYWRGKEIEPRLVVTSPSVRVGRLKSRETYEFRVRAQPAGSMGADATIKATTR